MKNRVKELRNVKASELIPNPNNWRIHPVDQVRAFSGLIDSIGFADVLLAYESEKHGGLTLVDGHMRAGLLGNEELPVAILDLNDEEADALILSLDPLGSMAKTNQEKAKKLADAVRQDLRATLQKVPAVEDILRRHPVKNPMADKLPTTKKYLSVCPQCHFEFSDGE